MQRSSGGRLVLLVAVSLSACNFGSPGGSGGSATLGDGAGDGSSGASPGDTDGASGPVDGSASAGSHGSTGGSGSPGSSATAETSAGTTSQVDPGSTGAADSSGGAGDASSTSGGSSGMMDGGGSSSGGMQGGPGYPPCPSGDDVDCGSGNNCVPVLDFGQIEWSVCGEGGCGSGADCDPPPSGNATPVCVPLSIDTCMLDCTTGTCPAGMECVGTGVGWICAWP